MDVDNILGKIVFGVLIVGVIVYFSIIITSTPAKCWISYSPFTCAKTMELEQILKDNDLIL